MANPPFVNLALHEGLEDTFLAGATIPVYSRVWLNSAGAMMPALNTTDLSVGVAKQPIANGSYGVVRLDAPEQFGLANTLVNVGDTVYQAANGYVSSSASNNAQLGVALSAAIVPGANTGNNLTPIVILAAKKSA